MYQRKMWYIENGTILDCSDMLTFLYNDYKNTDGISTYEIFDIIVDFETFKLHKDNKWHTIMYK